MPKRNNKSSQSKGNNAAAPKAKPKVVRAPTVAAARKMEVMDELDIRIPGKGEECQETIFPHAWYALF